jgi:Mg2+/Co2+ transporter CorB
MSETLELWLLGTAILVLILLSAFFNGSETALTGASKARMHALEQEGNKRARLVNRLLSHPEQMIGAVLIGNTLVDILAAALATSLAVRLFGDIGVAIATGIMTLLVVIFAAVLPKTLAIANPDRSALLVGWPMRVTIWILYPITHAVEWIVRQILWLTPGTADDDANILSAHDELRGAIDLHVKEGNVVKGDRDMLGGILDLKELEVSDVMVHRTEIDMVSADEPLAAIIEEAMKGAYSRLPVWKGQPDNIIGILNIKDLLRDLAAKEWNLSKVDVETLLTPAWFIPDTTSLEEQLAAFLERKSHIALVVDEYGEVQGLLTLEDIIEEIVGQISDEHDTPDSEIRPQPDGKVVVDGAVAIRDLNRKMEWNLPDDEATTVAGLVIHEAETIPDPGQVFTFHGYRFEVVKKVRNRITTVRVTPLPAVPV